MMDGGKTGWPPGMLQDDSAPLSRWLSRRLGAKFAAFNVGDTEREDEQRDRQPELFGHDQRVGDTSQDSGQLTARR